MSATNVGQPSVHPFYPMVNFYFTVKFSGISSPVDSKFKEVSGITMEMESGLVIKEGGENASETELPGRTKYSDLVLKRGMLQPQTKLTEWCMNFFRNDYIKPMQPKDIDVQLLNHKDNPLFTWHFEKAYPVKMEVSGFNSTGSGESGIVVETLTFKFKSFQIIKANN